MLACIIGMGRFSASRKSSIPSPLATFLTNQLQPTVTVSRQPWNRLRQQRAFKPYLRLPRTGCAEPHWAEDACLARLRHAQLHVSRDSICRLHRSEVPATLHMHIQVGLLFAGHICHWVLQLPRDRQTVIEPLASHRTEG